MGIETDPCNPGLVRQFDFMARLPAFDIESDHRRFDRPLQPAAGEAFAAWLRRASQANSPVVT